MNHGRSTIIACRTVIEEMQGLMPSDIESRTLESGPNLHPDKLRGTLQVMIDGITADTETIILGYGLCSMGVISLEATLIPLCQNRSHLGGPGGQVSNHGCLRWVYSSDMHRLIRQAIEAVERMGLSDEEKRKIYQDNAIKLLRLPLGFPLGTH